MNHNTAVSQLKSLQRTLQAYMHAMGVLQYDGATVAPDASVEGRAETRSYFAGLEHQLLTGEARRIAEPVLAMGCMAVMTGTLERGSYSERLLRQGRMKLLRYPVHLNHAQFERLKAANAFAETAPYHSPELSAAREILF